MFNLLVGMKIYSNVYIYTNIYIYIYYILYIYYIIYININGYFLHIYQYWLSIYKYPLGYIVSGYLYIPLTSRGIEPPHVGTHCWQLGKSREFQDSKMIGGTYHIYIGWWLVVEPWILGLSIYWECHHPNWLSYFFRGVEIVTVTTNQIYNRNTVGASTVSWDIEITWNNKISTDISET